MSEQDVKVKISIATPKADQAGETDSYTGTPKMSTSGPKETLFGPGSSNFEMGNKKTAQWKAMSGTSNFPTIPGAEAEDVFGLVGEYVTGMNAELDRMQNMPEVPVFVPKIPFDCVRMLYETPDPTEQIDLKKNVPNIPSFEKMFKEVGDLEYVEHYYRNRLGLINDLIKNTKNEIKKQKDPLILRARKEFLVFLKERKNFVQNQLGVLFDVANSKKLSISS